MVSGFVKSIKRCQSKACLGAGPDHPCPKNNKSSQKSFVSSSRRYIQNALERRFRPERFVETNATPFRIIFQDGLMSVRSYRAEGLHGDNAKLMAKRLPLLFIPPLGVPAWVFDLMHSRSLVRYFAQAGWDVYLVDWGSPGVVDAHLDLSQYVVSWMPKAITVVSEHAAGLSVVSHSEDEREGGNEGGDNIRGDSTVDSGATAPSQAAVPVTLAGYCMGGLLALMALGLETQAAGAADPEVSVATEQAIRSAQSLVRNIITIASPIDFHDTTGILGKVVTLTSKPLAWFERHFPKAWAQASTVLPERYFHVPGPMVAHAFAMTQPLSRLTSYMNLVWNLADRAYVIQYTALSSWFDDMLDYPGGVVRNLLFEIGPENQLIRGRITLGNRRVNLERVRANLLAVAGEADTLVSPSAAASIMAIVAAEDKTLLSAPGGHAGVFAGHGAPEKTWAPIEAWLSARGWREPHA